MAMQVEAIPEYRPEDSDSNDELQESRFFRRGCCCLFNLPCFGTRESNNWERISTSEKLDSQGNNVFSDWWDKGANALKKVREWSEVVAGPKWKTFIRRFNKTTTASKPGKFQYDPLSYALNFDDGMVKSTPLDDERGFRDFSSRYAPSRGGSMDMEFDWYQKIPIKPAV